MNKLQKIFSTLFLQCALASFSTANKFLFAPQILNLTDSTCNLEFKAISVAPK